MRDWKEHTRQMRAARADAAPGRRDEVLTHRGGGFDANALRRCIAALAFFEALEARDPVLAAQIGPLPWTQVELLKRWSLFAPATAHAAVPRLAAGNMTLDDMQRELKKARARAKYPRRNRCYTPRSPASERQYAPPWPGKWWPTPRPGTRPARHYRYVVRTSGKVVSVTVMLVGPLRQPPGLYEMRWTG